MSLPEQVKTFLVSNYYYYGLSLYLTIPSTDFIVTSLKLVMPTSPPADLNVMPSGASMYRERVRDANLRSFLGGALKYSVSTDPLKCAPLGPTRWKNTLNKSVNKSRCSSGTGNWIILQLFCRILCLTVKSLWLFFTQMWSLFQNIPLQCYTCRLLLELLIMMKTVQLHYLQGQGCGREG